MIKLEQIKAILLERVRNATRSDEPIWMRQKQALSLSSPCDRTNRSHESCGEEWEAGDVIGLRLRLDN